MKIIGLILLIGLTLLASCTVVPLMPETKPESFEAQVSFVEKGSVFSPDSSEEYWVVIEHASAMPSDLEVHTGDTVEWVNKDAETYTFKLQNEIEARLPPGSRVEYQFMKPGTYGYTARVVDPDDDRARIVRGIVVVQYREMH